MRSELFELERQEAAEQMGREAWAAICKRAKLLRAAGKRS